MRGDERAGMKIDFGGVVDALPGLVWTTQADGRSDFVNRGWREYTGLGLDEAIGHGWQAAIHPDDLTSFVESWDLIRQSGIGQEIDARLRRFDGQYRWFVFRPSPLPEDESSHPRWCWLGSYADESSRRRRTPASSLGRHTPPDRVPEHGHDSGVRESEVAPGLQYDL